MKSVLKACKKFTGEHPHQSVVPTVEITLKWVLSGKFAAYFQNMFL